MDESKIIVGNVSEITGRFFVRNNNGEDNEIINQTTIYLNDIVYSNSNEGVLKISLDEGGSLDLSGGNEIIIDEPLLTSNFSFNLEDENEKIGSCDDMETEVGKKYLDSNHIQGVFAEKFGTEINVEASP